MRLSNFRNRLYRDEAGQAIILGAVSVLVLAVTIMVTIQLGWTIRERLQLQHAADNAAYTTATVVARSLNYISFMNRAMIAQYVGAMSIQSFLGILEAITLIIGYGCSFIHNIGAVLGVVALIPVIGWPAKPFAIAFGAAGHGLREAADAVRTFIDDYVDDFVAQAVEAVSKFNKLTYSIAQKWGGYYLPIGDIAKSALPGGFYVESIKGTAPGAENGNLVYKVLTTILGEVSYLSLFSSYSDAIPDEKKDGDSDGIKRAERMMAELVNASREGKNGVNWETGRRFGLGEIFDAIDGSGDLLSEVGGILDELFPNSQGATMLVKPMDDEDVFLNPGGNSRNYVFENHHNNANDPHSYFSRGMAMVSADSVEPFISFIPDFIQDFLNMIGMPGAETTRVVGVQAVGKDDHLKGQRYHCKYKRYETVAKSLMDLIGNIKVKNPCKQTNSDGDVVDDSGNVVAMPSGFCAEHTGNKIKLKEYLESMDGFDDTLDDVDDALYKMFRRLIKGVPGQADIGCDVEEHHKFYGITKYMSFNIEDFEVNKRYPSFFAGVNKEPKFPIDVGLGFDQGQDFEMKTIGANGQIGTMKWGNCEDEFDGTCFSKYKFNHVDDVSILNVVKGMHALARSQVYYHRPGTWAEPPNMFNPFWHPKLSPMAPVLTEPLSEFSGQTGVALLEGLTSIVNVAIEGILVH